MLNRALLRHGKYLTKFVIFHLLRFSSLHSAETNRTWSILRYERSLNLQPACIPHCSFNDRLKKKKKKDFRLDSGWCMLAQPLGRLRQEDSWATGYWSKLKQNSKILVQNGEESCPFPRVFFPSPKLNFNLLSSDDDLVKERISFGGFLRGHREKLWVLSVKSFHMQKQYEGTGRNTAEDPWISHGQFTPNQRKVWLSHGADLQGEILPCASDRPFESEGISSLIPREYC